MFFDAALRAAFSCVLACVSFLAALWHAVPRANVAKRPIAACWTIFNIVGFGVWMWNMYRMGDFVRPLGSFRNCRRSSKSIMLSAYCRSYGCIPYAYSAKQPPGAVH